MERLDRRELVARAGRLAAGATVLGGLRFPAPAYAASEAGPTSRQLRLLAQQVAGPVIRRGTSAYAVDHRLFDTRFDSIHPAAIVYAESVADVEKTVTWAKRYGVHVVPRCGGHSYGGYSSVANGVVADVSRMDAVQAQAGGSARVGAGARLVEVYSKLWNQRRVTVPGGSCPTVGIAGLALGGGVGFSSRKFGTTSDNIQQLTIVTAAGDALVCSAGRNADLYWACRGGGGGNFGIVTSFVFRTHPVGQVSRFFITWPWSDAARAVRAWQAWAPHAPDGLFSVCSLSGGAGAAPSVAAEGQFFGSKAQLRRLLRPLLNAGQPSSVSVVGSSYLAAAMHWAGCTGLSLSQCQVVPKGRLPRSTFKAKSQYVLRPLSARGIQTMIHWIEQRGRIRAPGSGVIILDSYGGAINRVAPGATAFFHRNALFSMQYGAFWSASASRATAQANLNWVNHFYAAMKRFVSSYAYQNYIDPNLAAWKHAYYGSNLNRLVAVKRKYDPTNRFRFKQSIPTRL